MPLDLDDPTAVALAIFRTFSARRIEAALYGGLALAAYGEPRETRAADFAVAGLRGAAAALALADIGVRPVLALDRVRFGACSSAGSRSRRVAAEPGSTCWISSNPGRPDSPGRLWSGQSLARCAVRRSASSRLRTSCSSSFCPLATGISRTRSRCCGLPTSRSTGPSSTPRPSGWPRRSPTTTSPVALPGRTLPGEPCARRGGEPVSSCLTSRSSCCSPPTQAWSSSLRPRSSPTGVYLCGVSAQALADVAKQAQNAVAQADPWAVGRDCRARLVLSRSPSGSRCSGLPASCSTRRGAAAPRIAYRVILSPSGGAATSNALTTPHRNPK